MWMGAAGVGVVCIILAMTLPLPLVPFSGFAFALLGFWFSFVGSWRGKSRPGEV
jgi:hypothetical protein